MRGAAENMINIIACDDDKDIVRALKIYLSSEGFNVLEAYNGRQVLELLAENDVQLVLMDVMMPQMDGIEATAEIRKKYNVPVILITAKSEDYDKILGLDVGADDYITKPFNPVEVVARAKLNRDWYNALMHTMFGKIVLAVCGTVILVTALLMHRITKPVEYKR